MDSSIKKYSILERCSVCGGSLKGFSGPDFEGPGTVQLERAGNGKQGRMLYTDNCLTPKCYLSSQDKDTSYEHLLTILNVKNE